MVRHTNKAILTFVLAGLLSCSGCGNVNKIISKSKDAIGSVLPETEKKSTYLQNLDLAEAILWPEPAEISLDKDPFYPVVGKFAVSKGSDLSTAIDFALTGVFISEKESLAIISNLNDVFIVREGEFIFDFLVKEIGNDKVILERGAETIALKIEEED